VPGTAEHRRAYREMLIKDDLMRLEPAGFLASRVFTDGLITRTQAP
jgi:hypothetical protein